MTIKRLPTFKAGCACIICLIGLIPSVFAGDFNGSKPLFGTTGKIVEINQHKVIEGLDPDTVGLPKRFIIDFKAKKLRPSKDSIIRKTISFKRIDHIDNLLVIQGVDEGVEGVDDGLAWSLTISKNDGRAVLSASGDGVAYAVLGVCTPHRLNP